MFPKEIKKQLLILALQALVILFIFTLGFIFLYRKIDSHEFSIKNNRILLETLKRQEEKLSNLKNDYKDVLGATILLDSAYPQTEDPRPFLEKMTSLGDKTGNKTKVSPIGEIAELSPEFEGIKIIKFSVNLEGNIESFFDFLIELQKTNHFIIVESVNISSEGNWEKNLVVNLQAGVYVK